MKQESILMNMVPVAMYNNDAYRWTRGHAFVESSISNCIYRIKQVLDDKCILKDDPDFRKKMSIEYNAPRIEKALEEAVDHDSTFSWSSQI